MGALLFTSALALLVVGAPIVVALGLIALVPPARTRVPPLSARYRGARRSPPTWIGRPR